MLEWAKAMVDALRSRSFRHAAGGLWTAVDQDEGASLSLLAGEDDGFYTRQFVLSCFRAFVLSFKDDNVLSFYP